MFFRWAFLRETVNKVNDLPPHICRSPEEGDGSGPSLSFKGTLADPQLYQWVCWALPCSPTSTCKRFRLYRPPLLETGTCPPPSATGKDRGSQQGAKRKEVKATASVRRYLMSLSLCCAGWGRSGMSR